MAGTAELIDPLLGKAPRSRFENDETIFDAIVAGMGRPEGYHPEVEFITGEVTNR